MRGNVSEKARPDAKSATGKCAWDRLLLTTTNRTPSHSGLSPLSLILSPMSAINLSAPPAAPIDTTAGDIDQDQLFTCLSCAVAFLSPDEQREHMRSDWHRYNMKVCPLGWLACRS
jgi:hypothetical protein